MKKNKAEYEKIQCEEWCDKVNYHGNIQAHQVRQPY